jgi:sigma-B regulation protein RsbU (phosphoserine phosphatase)
LSLSDETLVHDLARETLERYRELNVLYRATEIIGACLNADAVPALLISEAQRVIPSDSAVVLLGHSEPGSEWAAAKPLIERVRETEQADYTDSVMCVPVRAGETVLGVVVLGRAEGRKAYTASDEKLLVGLAGQAGVALERSRLHEQETSRLRLEEELGVAHRIQLTLLPSCPAIDGWDFAATYEAARQVGGDFYDFLNLADDARRLGLVIADVTGKGVPAALMMAYSRAVLRAQSLAGSSPVEVLDNTNRVMMLERQTRPFLSAFYAELDLDTGRLVYANAGHDAPLWIDAGGRDWRELEGHGTILGAFNDLGLESREVVLGEGDTLVCYTDGVTEARDGSAQLFGDDRLAAAATSAVAAGVGARGVLEAIVGAVAEFTAGAAQADDLTVVVVQRGQVARG